jgi:predicted dehydrogenase
VTSNPDRAARAHAEFPGAQVVPSADAVWELAGEHDFVVVATSNDSHAPLARRAIELGLATVVDKPLAPTAAEASELIGLADAAGVLLTVYHQRRWDSDFLTLKRLIANGELGEVYRFESRFERWRPEAPEGSWRFETPRAQGGGVLLDLGTHLADQALQLFGPAAEIHGDVRSRRGTPGDDDAFISIRHESGTLSLVWASEVAADPGPRMRVLGSNGAFVVEGLDPQEEALRDGHRPDGDEWGVVPRERWGRLVRGNASEPVEPERGAWPEFYVRFAAGEAPVAAAEAVEVLRVLESAAASVS